MSHLPYVLQAHLGIGPEAHGGRAPRAPRNERLTSNLAATFSLNWNHCENGSANPVAAAGCTTYMGAPLSEQAGKGGGWPDASGSIHVFVADRLRTCGWSVTIIPEDYDEDAEEPSMFDLLKEADDAEQEGRRKRQKTGERTLRERELAHIRSSSWDYDSIKVFDADQKLIASFTTMSLDNPWLSIGCLNNQVSDRIYQLLQEDYDLAKFPHVREELPINTDAIDSPGSYRLEAVTGAKLGGETKSSVTTHFSLYYVSVEGGQSNDKVVAKALVPTKMVR